MTVVLESADQVDLSEHPGLAKHCCHGCDKPFEPTETIEVLYERISHRGYMIHYTCWDLLVDRLERRT